LRKRKTLVIGYGNPGRLDDGLGPACAERIDSRQLPGVTTDATYQLSIEDAATVAGYDRVVFADAAVDGQEPFSFRPVQPVLQVSFTSHSVAPGAVVAMAMSMFGSKVEAFALGIRGYEFNEFGERLSDRALKNLAAAVGFLEETIRFDRFAEYAAPRESGGSEEPRVVIDLTPADMN
jgi:hydrogenase maturation protease